MAEAAIQEAFRIRPNAGEAHYARAVHLYRGYRDFDGALAELEIARQTLPNHAPIFEMMGFIQRRQGRWEESTRNLERAAELDPRNINTLQQTCIQLRDAWTAMRKQNPGWPAQRPSLGPMMLVRNHSALRGIGLRKPIPGHCIRQSIRSGRQILLL